MSPITTGGFQVTARPGIEYLDPRLLTPQYGSIIPSISQGVGVANQFRQIQDEAKMRPIRAQLAQIQMQEAQDRMMQAPLQRRLKELQIQEAEQNAAIPRVLGGNVSIEEVPTSIYDMPALDDNGNRTGPVPMGDLVQITEEQLYGPGGIVTPRTVRKTVKTAAERVADEEKRQASIRATDALATSRTRGKEFESTALVDLYNNAVAEGDTEAAQLYKSRFDALNARKPTLTAEDFYDRRVAQLAADAGITYDNAMALARTPSGSEALATAAASNKAASKSVFGGPKLTPEQQAMVRGGPSAQQNLAAPDDFGSRASNLLKTSGAAPAFATPDEAAAAFAEGRIKKGDKIIVGGVSGTWK